ncbi:MAG TPA: amylo-alpha-1,6-glucosidase [Nitrospiraceae bacterium]|nr:amylo-alpha-1,6-glucosidase [Nitrospiraceae bacterium]
MEEIISVNDQFYILASSSMADNRTRVLKHGETFGVFDRYGDIQPVGSGTQGLFHEGTRFLSRQELFLDNDRLMLLSSTVKQDNALLAVDLTNPDLYRDGRITVPRGSVHVFRSRFLWNGVGYERFRISNYSLSSVSMAFAVRFEADFADIFEVRGQKRGRKGTRLDNIVERDQLILGYKGLDGETRQTRIQFSPPPRDISEAQATFQIDLEPKAETIVTITVGCDLGERRRPFHAYEAAVHDAGLAIRAEQSQDCLVHTSNAQFNEWWNRSLLDLRMMVTDTPEGPYPYAGVPWFSTPFGRDGIITAMECLWIRPELARGVLAYLASTQAREINAAQDAEPGKILHETRKGEMAALNEIPFGLYYGSVDSTPLFVMLAGAYYERTGDLSFIQAIWNNIERALAWIDRYGDPDRDGFLEYARKSPTGLDNQGWKDSHDSISHEDGSLGEGPIALCEVQGYVYNAKLQASKLADALGYAEQGSHLRRQAETLKANFEEVFWCDDLSTYALALDGRKLPCRVKSSNAGHCLYTGIASPERAQRLAETLMSDEMFSGWGVRTLADSERRYNPMSYHNGSVWPHDNAMIAAGLARYGLMSAVERVMTGLFEASLVVDFHRLPELFCGFVRRPGQGLTRYPVACNPQAWAAGSVFMGLQACLGLIINAPQETVTFVYPILPEVLHELHIKNLKVGKASLDIVIKRHELDVGIAVMRREGHVEVVVVK